MDRVSGKVRRKGVIRNDSKVRGLSNKKGGAATEEIGRAGSRFGRGLGSLLVLGHGPWMWDSGAQGEARAGDRNLRACCMPMAFKA